MFTNIVITFFFNFIFFQISNVIFLRTIFFIKKKKGRCLHTNAVVTQYAYNKKVLLSREYFFRVRELVGNIIFFYTELAMIMLTR